MGNLKERIFWQVSPIHQAVGTIHATVPIDLIPNFIERPRPEESIFTTLDAVGQAYPSLRASIVTAIKGEAGMILQKNADSFSPSAMARINGALRQLPEVLILPKEREKLKRGELYLLKHDIAAPLEYILFRSDSPSEYREFQKINSLFTRLQYQYSDYKYESGDNPLSSVYSNLLRDFASEAVLPATQRALAIPVEFGNYELYEVRSGFRQIAQISPLAFAEKFPLSTVIAQFTHDRKFMDKYTGKPVEIEIDAESTDPEVYMDKGALYRKLRNLLRDAVTHGEGPVIRPIIRVKGMPECIHLTILSPGHLEEDVLPIIGMEPYTTQDRGETLHGYGKVSARKLLVELWMAMGKTESEVGHLLTNHWSNIVDNGRPFVQWRAPLPYAG